jgi:hypothetical protein
MSKEEVEKKLEEIKRLYGGPPPQAILDVEAKDITPEVEPDFEVPQDVVDTREGEEDEPT